ncbi:unannotated protein [freshwater metagenome]|uniref:Unannotated protein n=1 Tax=freshwater metagenome TaxID=449393 RepID=A0A6J7CG53_9ZZZZ
MGLNKGANIFEQTFGQLRVVGVNLAGTLCTEDHKAVFVVNFVQQLVNRRVGDAFRNSRNARHVGPLDAVAAGPDGLDS